MRGGTCTFALFATGRAIRFRIPPGPYELWSLLVRHRKSGRAEVYTIGVSDFATAMVYVQRRTCAAVLYLGRRRAVFRIPLDGRAKQWRADNAEAYSIRLRLDS